MNPDAAAVAATLTKAQREAVISGRGFSRTVWAVFRMRPALFASASSHSGEGILRRPTDFCLAVRKHLEGASDGE